jgi:hypothetical protein
MRCTSCLSENMSSFTGETTIHFPGLRDIEEPPVYVSPKLVVCLACGATQFVMPEFELRLLAKAVARVAPSAPTHPKIGFRFPVDSA